MNLRLRDIRAIDKNTYEATFNDENGTTALAICSVSNKNGVEALKMNPDFIWTNQIAGDDRDVISAVLAFHHQQGSEREGNSSS